MQRRVVTLVGTVPCRGGFEGGQTSGLKTVKDSRLCQSLPENGEKASFEAPSRGTGNRRRTFEGGQTSGLEADKTQPIVLKLAGKA